VGTGEGCDEMSNSSSELDGDDNCVHSFPSSSGSEPTRGSIALDVEGMPVDSICVTLGWFFTPNSEIVADVSLCQWFWW
jgi:hypothetical protein